MTLTIMGNIFTITQDIRDVAINAFDTLIIELGKTCRLYYPPQMVACNCTADPVGEKPNNYFDNGGSVGFPLGSVCPECNGSGFRSERAYSDVLMLVNEDPKTFYKEFGVNIPDGFIQTKCLIESLNTILRCDYMQKDILTSDYLNTTYKINGQPIMPGNIIQRRYVVALWEKFH